MNVLVLFLETSRQCANRRIARVLSKDLDFSWQDDMCNIAACVLIWLVVYHRSSRFDDAMVSEAAPAWHAYRRRKIDWFVLTCPLPCVPVARRIDVLSDPEVLLPRVLLLSILFSMTELGQGLTLQPRWPVPFVPQSCSRAASAAFSMSSSFLKLARSLRLSQYDLP